MKKATSLAKARDGAKPDKTTQSKKKLVAKKVGLDQSAKATKKPTAAVPSFQERIVETKKDHAEAPTVPIRALVAPPLRNSDFPNTYIQQISVQLDDPDHPVALAWVGPQAAVQEIGLFRSSPGAGLKGLNCNDTATSRRSGSRCTPKGVFVVSGFQDHFDSDSRATYVTWFVRERGIALHYYPSVPKYPASHGCVRLESKRAAQIIQNNSRVGCTKVVIDGIWTRPAKQW